MKHSYEQMMERLSVITAQLVEFAIDNHLSPADAQCIVGSFVEKYSPSQLLTLLSTAKYTKYIIDMFKEFWVNEYRDQISTALTGLEKQIEETYGDERFNG